VDRHAGELGFRQRSKIGAVTDEQLKGLAHQAANMFRVDWEQGKRPQMVICEYRGDLNRLRRFEQTIAEKLGKNWAADKAAKVFLSRTMRTVVKNTHPEAMALAAGAERTTADNVLLEDQAIVGSAQTKDRVCFCICALQNETPPRYEFYEASDVSGLFQLYRECEAD
jgi:hypothetical protein